jgi:hypothetical protein
VYFLSLLSFDSYACLSSENRELSYRSSVITSPLFDSRRAFPKEEKALVGWINFTSSLSGKLSTNFDATAFEDAIKLSLLIHFRPHCP